MADENEFTERRKHKRFPIKGGIFALPTTSTTKFGKIHEISMSGLTVRHFDDEEWEEAKFDSDLILNENEICLDNVPVKLILDFEIKTKTPFKILSERHCVLKFGNLTNQHLSKLEDYIENFANTDVQGIISQ